MKVLHEDGDSTTNILKLQQRHLDDNIYEKTDRNDIII